MRQRIHARRRHRPTRRALSIEPEPEQATIHARIGKAGGHDVRLGVEGAVTLGLDQVDEVRVERHDVLETALLGQARADMEFLAREVASLRLGLGEVATRDFLRSELRGLLSGLEDKPEAEDD